MRRIHLRRRAVLVLLVLLTVAVAARALDRDDDPAAGAEVDPRPQAEATLEPPPTPEELERRIAGQVAEQDRAIARVLRTTPTVRAGSNRSNAVALTFDDGPGHDTDAILAELARFDARATFFPVGVAMEERPGIVKAILAEGHAVGSHTHGHLSLGSLPRGQQREQLDLQDRVFRGQGLAPPRMFRPPHGSYDATTLRLLEQRGDLLVMWSVDTDDYTRPGAREIARRVLSGAEPGAIVVMHDGGGDRSQTAAALPHILRGLRSRGLDVVTVPELLQRPGSPQSALPRPNPRN